MFARRKRELAPRRPTSVFDDVIVGILTVRSRRKVLKATLAEWRRFDVTPLVQLQPKDWPLSGGSHRRNADLMLRRALAERADARYILFCEDDVLLAPELDLWLPALKALNLPVTLFLNGSHHLPPSLLRRCAGRGPVPERIIRVHGLRGWWGSQALLLPREFVAELLRWESALEGWDIHFKEFLVRHGIPLCAPIPNLVQQRQVPTSISTNVAIPHSLTFGRPSDGGAISRAGIDWCPYGDWNPDPRPA